MGFMSYILGGWVVMMGGYFFLNKLEGNNSHHKCNCRNELLKIKKAEKQFNKTLEG